MIDHNVLRINWTLKIPVPNLTPGYLEPFSCIRYKEIPISIYSIVQTGKKIHDGGLKNGFLSKEYQFLMDEAVNLEPIIPASKQIPIAIISFL
jgi:hypothetical protein